MPHSYVKVRFRLLYRPRFQKEQPAVIGSIRDLGNWCVDTSLNPHQRARCLPVISGSEKGEDGQKVWETVMCVPGGTKCQWSWVILTPGGKLKIKESVTRNLTVGKNCVIVHSEWNICGEAVIQNTCRIDLGTKYLTLPGKVVGVCGSTDALGNWDAKKCIVMDSCFPKGSGKWRATFSVSNEIETEWKLVVIDKETKEIVRWEERDNRALTVCSQWMKMEVKWGEGEQVIDTISLDFDQNFNTKKLLNTYKQATGQDNNVAASNGMLSTWKPEILSSLKTCHPASAQSPEIMSVLKSSDLASAQSSNIQSLKPCNLASAQALSAASEFHEEQPSSESYSPKSGNHTVIQSPFNIASKQTEPQLRNQPISETRSGGDTMVSTQIKDVKPKVTLNEIKVGKTTTATIKRFQNSPNQRNTSMRHQSPCQVLLNAKSEVVSCIMLDGVTETSGDMDMQNRDVESPLKSSGFESPAERFRDQYVDDSDDPGPNPHEVPDGEMKSTFFSFERRNQAFQMLGHHRKYTFFPAFLIFLKVINDYYWNTK